MGIIHDYIPFIRFPITCLTWSCNQSSARLPKSTDYQLYLTPTFLFCDYLRYTCRYLFPWTVIFPYCAFILTPPILLHCEFTSVPTSWCTLLNKTVLILFCNWKVVISWPITTSYPSGQTAILCSSSGLDKQGFYTIVYDDTPIPSMLACFTPTGRGCCFYDNGVVRFLSNDAGGTLADEQGAITKRWSWPPLGGKLGASIILQVCHKHQIE